MLLPFRIRFAGLLLGPMIVVGVGLLLQPLDRNFPSTGHGYAEHPPLGHTGGFGEPTCHACHFGGEVNGGDGSLSVEGLPEAVRPGRSYEVTVRLAASMGRSGFMMALRRPDGTQAGGLMPLDTSRVAVDTADSSDVQYAHHTLAGADVSGAETSWSVQWTAPEAAGDSVRVHVSANAANDDASEFGDDVYTTRAHTVVTE